ncbi:MAG: class I SAM-dependent methyltransferase [Candidatus Woesearchaeota archaeon]|nr:MAG: class I SAM-dependent methyltransferase [Candidatus Woesearchaeota archaeon]
MKEIIRKRYDESAEFYDSRYNRIQEEKYEIMSQYFPKNWELALDLGCGTGLLSKKLDNLIGMDISFGMLEIAKEQGEKVVQAESESLPFKSQVFDVVFSFTVLQSSNELKKSVDEAKRVLKPNGILILTYLEKKFDLKVISALRKNFDNIKQVPCGEDIGLICS